MFLPATTPSCTLHTAAVREPLRWTQSQVSTDWACSFVTLANPSSNPHFRLVRGATAFCTSGSNINSRSGNIYSATCLAHPASKVARNYYQAQHTHRACYTHTVASPASALEVQCSQGKNLRSDRLSRAQGLRSRGREFGRRPRLPSGRRVRTDPATSIPRFETNRSIRPGARKLASRTVQPTTARRTSSCLRLKRYNQQTGSGSGS